MQYNTILYDIQYNIVKYVTLQFNMLYPRTICFLYNTSWYNTIDWYYTISCSMSQYNAECYYVILYNADSVQNGAMCL